MDIQNEITQFIASEILVGQPNDSLTESLDLLDMGILDSLSIVNLVQFIESKFKIKVDLGAVTPENFNSIQAITIFVSSQMSQ